MTPSFSDFDQELRSLRRRQLRRILRQSWRDLPGADGLLLILRESLSAAPTAARRCLLDSPLLGGWIQDVLFWRETMDRSRRLLTGTGSSSRKVGLFDLMARTEFLAETVPAGRLDPGFARRVRARAVRMLTERLEDLPRILWPHIRLPDGFRIPFRFDENTDEGCPAGRIRLGITPGVLLRRVARSTRRLTARIEGRSLVLSGPVEPLIHETIPGTSILLTHRLVSTSDALRVGKRVPGVGRRLARALALVERAWPAAGEEIRRRTWMVVPLVEPGTVSYSHLARPGISYISVFRGTLVDLADDLLHETAHHRLHARQELACFARDDGEPRYFSPWRQSTRPLNGILHGTYTFLFRAELFLRLAGAAGVLSPSRRKWVRAEARREIENCACSLKDLAGARRQGLLTPAGRILTGEMARRLARLRKGRLSEGGNFSIF